MLKRIYAISDLHLGGKYEENQRGFRLCTQQHQIAHFIGHLTGEKPGVELIINGDFVDFLAEEGQEGQWSDLEPDPAVAVRKFQSIVRRNQEVFTALRAFLNAGHRLVLLLGNHDLELSYPAVRKSLQDELQTTGKDFEFVYDGEGYVVGDVLFEHGNRYDKWNMVDHNALRQARSAQSRFQESSLHLRSPAGSQLVANVMNPLKARYSFLDLLKPELHAAVPLLLALEPGAVTQLSKISVYFAKAQGNSLDGATPAASGNISVDGEVDERAALSDALRVAFGDRQLAREFYSDLPRDAVDGRISVGDRINQLLEDGRSLVRQWTQQALTDNRRRMLRSALKAMLKGEVAGPDQEGYPEYLTAAQKLAGQGPIRHVVFGHTHHPKKIALERGGFYINTGTWADVLEFPRELLDLTADENLENFIQRMAKNDLTAWEMFHPTYAYLEIEEGSAREPELRSWQS